MSGEQTVFVIALFAGVVVLSVAMIAVAVAVRRRRSRLIAAGPGGPGRSAPGDPWRRFTAALAAPYARTEWHLSRGAKRRLQPDQTYAGYASVLDQPTLRSSLRRDWGVRDAGDAEGRCGRAISALAQRCAALSIQGGSSRREFTSGLERSGGPSAAIEFVAATYPVVSAREASTALASSDGGGAEAGSGELAFDVARFANLVRWSAALGLLDEVRAHECSDVIGVVAASCFESWEAFGRAYQRGLAAAGRGSVKSYARAVEWLLEAPESPWLRESWPSRGAV